MKTLHNILLTAILSTLVSAVGTLRADVLAGPLTNPANQHLYYLLTTNTWSGAEAEAQTLGGHLVTINDMEEHDWVYTNFSMYGGVAHHLWIGLRRTGYGWSWVNRESLNFTYFAPGEPNNCDGIEDRGMIFGPTSPYAGPPGFWNDIADSGIGGCGGGDLAPNGVVEIGPPALTILVSAVDVCWSSISNHNYQLEYLTNFGTNASWEPLGSPVLASGPTTCITDQVNGQLRRFYRVRQLD